MKKLLRRDLSLACACVLLAAAALTTSCQASDSDMDALFDKTDAERADTKPASTLYGAFTPGTIQETVVVASENPDESFTITSTQAASCSDGAVSYLWQIKQDDMWSDIPGASSPSLTTETPMAFATVYRRQARCATQRLYSNECTVYNMRFLDGGAIPDSVHLNRTGFNTRFEIESLREASSTNYRWEIDEGNGWEAYSGFIENGSFQYNLPEQRTTRFRRSIVTPLGTAYSNICTVVNHAVRDDPRQGSIWTNPVKLGPFSGNFSQTVVIDTRAEYFRDSDLLRFAGNDAYLELEITENMYLEIMTCSVPMGVWMDVWLGKEYKPCFSGGSSDSIAWMWGSADYIPFPGFDDPDATIVTVGPDAGTYSIQLQGLKASNAGTVNGIICFKVRGVLPMPTPEPTPFP